MSLEQYLVPVVSSLCWDCANCFGGCPWTEEAASGGTRFAPAPGWTARRSHRWPDGWMVIACPLFRGEKEETI